MEHCRVYWGSHGCELERGHEGPHLYGEECRPYGDGRVGEPPYYGPDTNFYGEDATPESVGQWGKVLT